MPKRIGGLLLLMLLILAGLWWRWVWLPPADLDLVAVNIELPEQEHPLDELLRRYIAAIGSSPSLLTQLRQRANTFLLTNLQVDACEVTQGQYRRFANWRAAQVHPPLAHWATPQGWDFKSQTQNHQLLGRLGAAAGGLSYYDAWAYCAAVGGRLPATAEFEAIASGAQGKLYPWGNAFDNTPWRSGDPSQNIVQQCGQLPSTDTPEGIHELGSSLLEWTSDETGQPVLMGGNAWHRPYRLHALNFIRRRAAADFRSAYTGFRCVYDQPHPHYVNERPMPWGESTKVVSVAGGQRHIGPPEGSRVLPLLRSLEDEKIGILKHLPITPKSLDIQVMRHEVSREVYARFLRDPLVRLGFFNHPKQPVYIHHEPDNWAQQREVLAHPVTRVSWWSAWAFARWAGGDLPTAEQWQRLAGASLQRFPYGNDYVQGRAVDRLYSDQELQSAAVTASKDESAQGVIGFGGNVAEWTSTSVLRGNSFNIVIKGGSYLMPADGSQVAQTSEAVPDYQSEDLGFRLVFPPAAR